MTKTEKIYSDILKLIEKHKDEVVFDVGQLKRDSERHLFGLRLKDEYGLDVNPKAIHSTDWVKLNDYITVSQYGEKYNRTISWPVDGRQPEDGEYLMNISFPTGAYIFGQHYPVNIFQGFWDELKSYSPKYRDDVNHCIYFSLDTASKVFNEFGNIFKKHRELSAEDYKERRKKELEDELEKLNN